MKLNSLLPRLFLLGVLAAVPSFSATVTFDRGLPNASNGGFTYVNAGATGGQSNTSWESGFTQLGNYYLVGDTFSEPFNGIVNSLTVYEVANNGVGSAFSSLPTNEFNAVNLYLGTGTGNVNGVSSTYTYQQVGYQPGNLNYNTGGGQFAIYALTFSGLNFAINAGQTYSFALDAVGNPLDTDPLNGFNGLFLHATNGPLGVASGTLQQGFDNNFLFYGGAGPGLGTYGFVGACDSGNAGTCGGWDKSSDINVSLSISVPEPSTIGLMGLGLTGLLAFARRMRRT